MEKIGKGGGIDFGEAESTKMLQDLLKSGKDKVEKNITINETVSIEAKTDKSSFKEANKIMDGVLEKKEELSEPIDVKVKPPEISMEDILDSDGMKKYIAKLEDELKGFYSSKIKGKSDLDQDYTESEGKDYLSKYKELSKYYRKMGQQMPTELKETYDSVSGMFDYDMDRIQKDAKNSYERQIRAAKKELTELHKTQAEVSGTPLIDSSGIESVSEEIDYTTKSVQELKKELEELSELLEAIKGFRGIKHIETETDDPNYEGRSFNERIRDQVREKREKGKGFRASVYYSAYDEKSDKDNPARLQLSERDKKIYDREYNRALDLIEAKYGDIIDNMDKLDKINDQLMKDINGINIELDTRERESYEASHIPVVNTKKRRTSTASRSKKNPKVVRPESNEDTNADLITGNLMALKQQNLLEHQYGQIDKTGARKQLKEAYEEYQKYFSDDGVDFAKIDPSEMSEAGREAGYAYIRAWQEAVECGVADSFLEKNKALNLPLDDLEKVKALAADYEQVIKEISSQIYMDLGNKEITEDLSKQIQEYIKQVAILKKQETVGLVNTEELQAQTDLVAKLRNEILGIADAKEKASEQGDTPDVISASGASELDVQSKAMDEASEKADKTTKSIKELVDELLALKKVLSGEQKDNLISVLSAPEVKPAELRDVIHSNEKLLNPEGKDISRYNKKNLMNMIMGNISKANEEATEAADAATSAAAPEPKKSRKKKSKSSEKSVQETTREGHAATGQTNTDLEEMDKKVEELNVKAVSLVQTLKELSNSPVESGKTDEYYNGLYENINKINEEISELINNLNSLKTAFPEGAKELFEKADKIGSTINNASMLSGVRKGQISGTVFNNTINTERGKYLGDLASSISQDLGAFRNLPTENVGEAIKGYLGSLFQTLNARSEETLSSIDTEWDQKFSSFNKPKQKEASNRAKESLKTFIGNVRNELQSYYERYVQLCDAEMSDEIMMAFKKVAENVVRVLGQKAKGNKAFDIDVSGIDFEGIKPDPLSGLSDKEKSAVETFLKKMKTMLKENYDEASALIQALDLLSKIKAGDVGSIMDDFKNPNKANNAMLGVMTGMPVNNQNARDAALRSINEQGYDKAIEERTEAARKKLEEEKQQFDKEWQELTDAMIGGDAFKKESKTNKEKILKYFKETPGGIDTINKAFLNGELEGKTFKDKYAAQYLAFLKKQQKEADSLRKISEGDKLKHSDGSVKIVTEEEIKLCHQYADQYDELIAKKREYYGIKAPEPIQNLQEMEGQLEALRVKAEEVLQQVTNATAMVVAADQEESYYTNLLSNLERINEQIVQLRENLSKINPPETATHLTGMVESISNQLMGAEVLTTNQSGVIHQVYDSIDFEAQRARKEEEERIARRQNEMATRISSNSDFKLYGEESWFQEYLERARKETTEIDQLYADFESKLEERKKSILEEQARENQQKDNKSNFQAFLKTISSSDEEFGANFVKYADLFNSITHDVSTLDAAINKVKEDLASMKPAQEEDLGLGEVSEEEDKVSEAAKKIAESFAEQFGLAKRSVKELEKAITDMIQKLFSGELPDYTSAIKGILSSDNNFMQTDLLEEVDQAKKIRQFLKGQKIKILDDYRQESGDDWASDKGLLGFNIMRKEGTDLMTVLKEMNESIGTTFDLDVSNAQAWRNLVDAIKDGVKPAGDLVDQLLRIGDLNLQQVGDDLKEQVESIATSIKPDITIPEEDDSWLDEIMGNKNPGGNSSTSSGSKERTKALEEEEKQAEETADALERVVYHYGNISSSGRLSHQFGDEINAWFEGIRNGGRGYADGTGTYVSSDSTQYEHGDFSDPLKKFYAIDTSKLKLYEAHTEESAEQYYRFIHQLEQFCIKAGIDTDAFDETLQGINVDSLYQSFKKVFSDSEMTFDEFKTFIDNMTALVAESGLRADGSVNAKKMFAFKKANGVDDIKTRLMKMLGYQGTDLSGTSYDSLDDGSVLFDTANVKDNIIKTGKTIQDVIAQTKSTLSGNESLQELVELYHQLGTTGGTQENLDKISSAILDIVQAESKLDSSQMQKFVEVLKGLTFVDGDSPITKVPYTVEQAIDVLNKLKNVQEDTPKSLESDTAAPAIEEQNKLQGEMEETGQTGQQAGEQAAKGMDELADAEKKVTQNAEEATDAVDRVGDTDNSDNMRRQADATGEAADAQHQLNQEMSNQPETTGTISPVNNEQLEKLIKDIQELLDIMHRLSEAFKAVDDGSGIPNIFQQISDVTKAIKELKEYFNQIDFTSGATEGINKFVQKFEELTNLLKSGFGIKDIKDTSSIPTGNIKDEINSLGTLEKKLNTDIPKAIETKDEKFGEELGVVRNVVKREKAIIGELENELSKGVPNAIEAKNAAFDAEEKHLRMVIDSEKQILGDLVSTIENIGTQLNNAFSNGIDTSTFQTLFDSISDNKEALKSFAEILRKTKEEQKEAAAAAKEHAKAMKDVEETEDTSDRWATTTTWYDADGNPVSRTNVSKVKKPDKDLTYTYNQRVNPDTGEMEDDGYSIKTNFENVEKSKQKALEKTEALIIRQQGSLDRIRKQYIENADVEIPSGVGSPLEKLEKQAEDVQKLFDKIRGNGSYTEHDAAEIGEAVKEYKRMAQQAVKDQKVATNLRPDSLKSGADRAQLQLSGLSRMMQNTKADTTELEQELEKLQQSLNSSDINKKFLLDLNDQIKSLLSRLKNVKQEYDEIEKTMKRYQELRFKKVDQGNLDPGEQQELDKIEERIDTLIEKQKVYINGWSAPLSKNENAMLAMTNSVNKNVEDRQYVRDETLRLDEQEAAREEARKQAEQEIKSEEQRIKAVNEARDKAIAKIKELYNARTELNRIEAQEASDKETERTNEHIEALIRYEKALEDATVAKRELYVLKEVDNIDVDPDELFNDALSGSGKSIDAKINANRKAAANELEKQIKEQMSVIKEAGDMQSKLNTALAGQIRGNVPTDQIENLREEVEKADQAAEKAAEAIRQLLTEAPDNKSLTTERISELNNQLVEMNKYAGTGSKSSIQGIERAQNATKNREDKQTLNRYADAVKEYRRLYMEGIQDPRNMTINETTGEKELKPIDKWEAYYKKIAAQLKIINDIEREWNEDKDRNIKLTNKQTEAHEMVIKAQREANNSDSNYSTENQIKENALREEAIKQYDKLSEKIQKMYKQSEWRSEGWKEAVSELENQITSLTPEDVSDEAGFKKLLADLREIESKAQDVQKSIRFRDVGADWQMDAKNKLLKWLEQNKKAATEMRIEFKNLEDSIEGVGNKADAEIWNENFLNLQNMAMERGLTGKSLGDRFKDQFANTMTSLATYYLSFQDFIRYGRQAIETVRELDTQLTEMRKVSNESLESLQAYQLQTFDIADRLGTTAAQIQSSTADWLRLGKELPDATAMAELSTKLLNVSEFTDIQEATNALVSSTQAYTEVTGEDIVDKLNLIGNNFSVSTDELAQGLQNAAAVLKTQGNSIDEALALLTAGNSITQDMSKVSAGVRTISLRISGTEEAKNEIAELGEDIDDFVVRTKSKTDQLIRDYTAVRSNNFQGVSVLDDNGNLRSTYDI